ncbi:hypothetical protein Bca4012_013091 [Brassica carinata]
MASVSQAIVGDSWGVSRGHNRILQLLQASMPPSPPMLNSSCSYVYLWQNSDDSPPGIFSFSKNWDIHPPPPTVPWFNAVWFKSRVPKHAFLALVSARSGLLARDRLLG